VSHPHIPKSEAPASKTLSSQSPFDVRCLERDPKGLPSITSTARSPKTLRDLRSVRLFPKKSSRPTFEKGRLLRGLLPISDDQDQKFPSTLAPSFSKFSDLLGLAFLRFQLISPFLPHRSWAHFGLNYFRFPSPGDTMVCRFFPRNSWCTRYCTTFNDVDLIQMIVTCTGLGT
jgi:hypothetical protein